MYWGLGHLRGRDLQPIHRRSLRCPKVRLAASALIARPPSVTPIAHDKRLRASGIRAWRQTGLLLSRSLVHTPPPTPSSITPFKSHYLKLSIEIKRLPMS